MCNVWKERPEAQPIRYRPLEIALPELFQWNLKLEGHDTFLINLGLHLADALSAQRMRGASSPHWLSLMLLIPADASRLFNSHVWQRDTGTSVPGVSTCSHKFSLQQVLQLLQPEETIDLCRTQKMNVLLPYSPFLCHYYSPAVKTGNPWHFIDFILCIMNFNNLDVVFWLKSSEICSSRIKNASCCRFIWTVLLCVPHLYP